MRYLLLRCDPLRSSKVAEGGQGPSPDVEYFQIGKLEGIKGPVRSRLLEGAAEDRVGLGMSVSRINGHIVPVAATAEDVGFAFKRAWQDHEKSIEVVFKDIGHEEWILSLRNG